jgi:hypothetical protein
MEPSELLERVARTFEALSIPYLVTGSMATIIYGEPRFTNDIDVVVRLRHWQVDALCAAFPGEEFYVSPETAREAVDHSGQFNILHPGTGLNDA